MNFKETVSEVNRIIAASLYSKEEISAFWRGQAEEQWEPEVLICYAAAMEYLNKQGNTKEAESIRNSYLRRLDELKERYSYRGDRLSD